jgi:hypothetical protein
MYEEDRPIEISTEKSERSFLFGTFRVKISNLRTLSRIKLFLDLPLPLYIYPFPIGLHGIVFNLVKYRDNFTFYLYSSSGVGLPMLLSKFITDLSLCAA